MAHSQSLIHVNYPCLLFLLLKLCTKYKCIQIKIMTTTRISTTTITLFIMSPYGASVLDVLCCLISPLTLWGRCCCSYCCCRCHPHSVVRKLRHKVLDSNPALLNRMFLVTLKLVPVILVCVTAIPKIFNIK